MNRWSEPARAPRGDLWHCECGTANEPFRSHCRNCGCQQMTADHPRPHLVLIQGGAS